MEMCSYYNFLFEQVAHRTKYEEPYEGELDSHGGIIVKEMLKKLSTIGATVLVSGIVLIPCKYLG